MDSPYQKLIDRSFGNHIPTECDEENYKYLSQQSINLFTSKDYDKCEDDTFRVIDALKAIEANKKAHHALVKKFFDVLQECDGEARQRLLQNAKKLQANLDNPKIDTPTLADDAYEAGGHVADLIEVLEKIDGLKDMIIDIFQLPYEYWVEDAAFDYRKELASGNA